jgi:non-heme chloroperoxidase
MLIISGEKDHIAPSAIATASVKKQRRSSSPTDCVEMTNRGHSPVFDSGWHEVADRALGFLKRHQ